MTLKKITSFLSQYNHIYIELCGYLQLPVDAVQTGVPPTGLL